MWTAIAVLTVIYVAVVGYALASSQADTSALLWILVMVPSVFAAGVVILWKRPDHRIGRLLTLAAITMFVIPTILEVVTVVRFEMGGEREQPADAMVRPLPEDHDSGRENRRRR